MPVFEYRCTNCEMTFDIFHKGREIVEDVVCPSCGSTNHRRLMSAPNVAASGGSDHGVSAPPCERAEGCCCGECTLK